MTYIFLDESGDLGFNPKKKNSKYFIISILSAPNKKPLEKLIKKIHSQLRKKVKKISGGILHAYKEKPITRKRILQQISRVECSIMYIYLNKSKVYTKLHNEKHVLYNYVANILIDRIVSKKLVETKQNIILIASQRETNKFLNENFKLYLKNQIKDKHKLEIEIEIKSPNQEKSLQAVDFVSWAIFRKHERGENAYFNLIKKKIFEANPLFP